MQPSQIISGGQGWGGSDIFPVHFKKSKQPNANGLYEVTCNYCQKKYAFRIGGGYRTFRRHLTTKHPNKLGVKKQQTQISRYTCFSSTSSQLFKYSDETNKVELAKMISMEHLSFNFGEKIGFVNYCQNALNPCAKRIPKNTLKRTLYKLYSKEKKELHQFF